MNTDGNPWRAQWGASLTGPQDRQIIQALEAAMPPVCSAFPASDQYEFTKGTLLGNFDTYVLEGDDPLPLNSHEVLHAFLEDGIDFLIRYVAGVSVPEKILGWPCCIAYEGTSETDFLGTNVLWLLYLTR